MGWEDALNKFVDEWKNKKEVVGILVCGSYITGYPSKHSDIDVQIVLDKKIKWRERGNKIIEGYLIEYFANPCSIIENYFKMDFEKRRRVAAHMFYTGKIVFDKKGCVAELVKKAEKYMNKKYPLMKKADTELMKYRLWDLKDNLEEIYERNNDEFYFVYYDSLKEVIDSYSRYLGFDFMPAHRVKDFLIDEAVKKKYKIRDFPDREFVILFNKALKCKKKGEMMISFETLINHVFEKMGGFNINGWKIKTKVDFD